MHVFRYTPVIVFLILLCGFAKGQTAATTFTPKKQKGKWGLVDANNTPVTSFVYDSVTTKQFEIRSIVNTSKSTMKAVVSPKTFFYLWANGKFDVFDNSMLAAAVTGFEPCRNYTDNRIYAFSKGALWGWGATGSNAAHNGIATEAIYDSVKFLESSNFLFNEDSYSKNGYQLDMTGYSYYAQYLSTLVQVYKNGCITLVSSAFPQASVKEHCDAAGFISIPEIFMVKKKGAGKFTYTAFYNDAPLTVAYDSVASVFGMWMGFNNETGMADLYIDGEKKTIAFASIQDWAAVQKQFRNEIALQKDELAKKENAAKQQAAENQKQLDIAKAKEQEQQQKAQLQKAKAAARKTIAAFKEAKYSLFNWNSNDSLLGVKAKDGKPLLYPSAKRIELNSGNNFTTAVYNITRYGDINVESGYNIKAKAALGAEVLPEELAGKILYSIDTTTAVQRIPSLSLRADMRIYEPKGKKYFIYTMLVSPEMNPEQFDIYEARCPVCNGRGFITEGDSSVKVVKDTEKKLKKTGTVSTTKKNYLANERVVNGRLEAPTYTESYDKYEYVDVVTSREVVNLKRVTCYGCKGTKRAALSVTWDVLAQKYTCQTH